MSKRVYAIEGIDHLTKSTLIDGIRQAEGYYEVIHFTKPEKLKLYAEKTMREMPWGSFHLSDSVLPLLIYQQACFWNSMVMVQSGARLIFDRWHLGEVVYSPLYRGYSGDYVFALEYEFDLDELADVRLILLTEDFTISKHFVSDGESFDDGKRKEEQALFIKAFERSIIRDKRVICVTDPETGFFKRREQILEEALT